MLSTESTLNEIAGVSSTAAEKDAVNDDLDKDKGAGADTDDDKDKSASREEKNVDGHKDGDEDAEGKDKKDTDIEDDDKSKAPLYHKDPEFQRMKKERNEAREEVSALKEELAEFRGQMSTLMDLVKAGKAGKGAEDGDGEEGDYKDITAMSEEELSEWQSRDPKGYAANMLAQVRAELTAEQRNNTAREAQERTREANRKTYDQYVKDNPDFETMWKKGEIQRYIEKHPGHNPLSAHMALTMGARLEEAIKKKEKEIESNIRAKLKAGTLDGRGSTGIRRMASADDVAELKDTKSKGGIVSAIADRLKAKRAATGR